MKTFYSIIRITPNNISGDNVSIGILLFDGIKFNYYFSDKKRRIAAKLLDENIIDLDFIVKQFALRFDEINEDSKDLKLFSRFDNLRDLSYFEYLNKYSNGLIQFSSPILVNDDSNQFDLEKLANLVFDESLLKSKPIEDVKSVEAEKIITDKLINPVKDKIHTFYKFSTANLQSIFFPFEMDCIGKNGSLIGAKYLPFDKTKQSLDNSLSHYITLISTLANTYNKQLKENSFFLIADEPTDINSPEHKLWESVNSNELLKVIHPEQAAIVAELVLEKKARRFLD